MGNEQETTKIMLITDSILKHVTTEHVQPWSLIKVRVTKTSGLAEAEQKVRQVKPQYIYIHVGVNDIHNKEKVHIIVYNLYKFTQKVREISETTIIISLPLLNASTRDHHSIFTLREHIINWVMKEQQNNQTDTITINPNNNFFKNNTQRSGLFAQDGLHLSKKGENVITENMRYILTMMENTHRTNRRRE